MTAVAGDLVARLDLDARRFKREVADSKSVLGRFKGFAVRNAGAIALGVGAAVAGGVAASIKAAADMEETMNKFNVVFGENSKAVKMWSDGLAADLGRSKQQIAEFMAGSQDLFVPLGFAADEALRMSKQVTQLSIDLASFNNMADADTLRDLQAALTGSGEVMKKYGVIVSEAAVKQELFQMGLDPKAASDQQKVLARLNIIMKGTTAAQGDAERSAGSFTNQMKGLNADLSDLAVTAGEIFIPALTKIIGWARSGLKVFNALLQPIKLVVDELGRLADIAGRFTRGAFDFLTFGIFKREEQTSAQDLQSQIRRHLARNGLDGSSRDVQRIDTEVHRLNFDLEETNKLIDEFNSHLITAENSFKGIRFHHEDLRSLVVDMTEALGGNNPSNETRLAINDEIQTLRDNIALLKGETTELDLAFRDFSLMEGADPEQLRQLRTLMEEEEQLREKARQDREHLAKPRPFQPTEAITFGSSESIRRILMATGPTAMMGASPEEKTAKNTEKSLTEEQEQTRLMRILASRRGPVIEVAGRP